MVRTLCAFTVAPSERLRRRVIVNRRNWLIIACACFSGCVTLRRPNWLKSPTTQSENPIHVRAQNLDDCWEKTHDLVTDYFEIAKENRLDGMMETRPNVGASLLEPWHRDSPGLRNRLESTLQSIRRRAYVSVTPDQTGSFLIGVEVFKETEDVPQRTENSPGAATFQEHRVLERDLTPTNGHTAPEGWVSLGRDALLEQRMLRELRLLFGN